jgi:hypothetical protein
MYGDGGAASGGAIRRLLQREELTQVSFLFFFFFLLPVFFSHATTGSIHCDSFVFGSSSISAGTHFAMVTAVSESAADQSARFSSMFALCSIRCVVVVLFVEIFASC